MVHAERIVNFNELEKNYKKYIDYIQINEYTQMFNIKLYMKYLCLPKE